MSQAPQDPTTSKCLKCDWGLLPTCERVKHIQTLPTSPQPWEPSFPLGELTQPRRGALCHSCFGVVPFLTLVEAPPSPTQGSSALEGSASQGPCPSQPDSSLLPLTPASSFSGAQSYSLRDPLHNPLP